MSNADMVALLGAIDDSSASNEAKAQAIAAVRAKHVTNLVDELIGWCGDISELEGAIEEGLRRCHDNPFTVRIEP
jgi:hypothetical protein